MHTCVLLPRTLELATTIFTNSEQIQVIQFNIKLKSEMKMCILYV